jgi:hypothetical protein
MVRSETRRNNAPVSFSTPTEVVAAAAEETKPTILREG